MNTSVTMHSTYRLATHELQDDKLSVRKATLPCKKQGFLTLGALRPGLTPPVYPTCWLGVTRQHICLALALKVAIPARDPSVLRFRDIRSTGVDAEGIGFNEISGCRSLEILRFKV